MERPRPLADALLRLIWRERAISRAEIARRTELSRSTVSEIVTTLLRTGLVDEGGTGASRGGRRPIVLQFQDDACAILGVDMGAAHVAVALTNLRGQLLGWEERRHAVRTPFYYLKNGQFNIVEETILNTTPYLATQANKVKLAVVGFNISTEAIEVYSGTEIVFSALTPPPLPVNLPTTFFPSFLVKLRYNITELFETDITDARFALQELGTGGSGWPFTYIVTVSQTDPDADYSDLQSALTGIENNGTVILLDVGIYTGDFTCSHPVAIHGPEQGLAVITGTLTLSYAYGTNVIRNVYINKTSGSAVTVVSSATSLSLYNCQISVNGPNNSSTIAPYISAGSNLKLYETEINTAGLANPRCIKKASGASVTVQVWGGYLEGTLEIAAANGSGELLLPKTGSTFSYSASAELLTENVSLEI